MGGDEAHDKGEGGDGVGVLRRFFRFRRSFPPCMGPRLLSCDGDVFMDAVVVGVGCSQPTLWGSMFKWVIVRSVLVCGKWDVSVGSFGLDGTPSRFSDGRVCVVAAFTASDVSSFLGTSFPSSVVEGRGYISTVNGHSPTSSSSSSSWAVFFSHLPLQFEVASVEVCGRHTN